MSHKAKSARTLTVWVQDSFLRRLDRAAKQLGLSRSDVVRAAIADGVAVILEKGGRDVSSATQSDARVEAS